MIRQEQLQENLLVSRAYIKYKLTCDMYVFCLEEEIVQVPWKCENRGLVWEKKKKERSRGEQNKETNVHSILSQSYQQLFNGSHTKSL